ncbi:MAG: hypothetical protein WC799_17790 [Desulfobacteraceae bacterium]|jgi:hypothetical protein
MNLGGHPKHILIISILFLWLSLWFSACAHHAARQSEDERVKLKAPLAQGEHVVRANSCSKVDRADFLGGGTAKFGSCYLTNLRFIYEESEWARTLAAVGNAVPTQGDFGMKHLLKGAYNVFNANYIIQVGNTGGLHLVVRTGQIIIPLPDILNMKLSGSRFSSDSPSDMERVRWLTITTRDGSSFIFEIYNLPPDKTGVMPSYESWLWKKDIQRVRNLSFK